MAIYGYIHTADIIQFQYLKITLDQLTLVKVGGEPKTNKMLILIKKNKLLKYPTSFNLVKLPFYRLPSRRLTDRQTSQSVSWGLP